MNKHIKGFNISKVKHMRKKSISRNKFNDNASQTACLYDPYIFRVLEKIPIDHKDPHEASIRSRIFVILLV